MRDALGAPALGLFAALLGFGAMARDMGLDLSIAWAAVALVWSMPALMTYAELAVAGGGLGVMFSAVLFSNLRNIPMIVTALPLVRHERKLSWRDMLFAQILSPTVWVHVLTRAQEIPLKVRRSYFTGFALTLYISALAGTLAGYFGFDGIPRTLAVALLLLTPIYLLLIMVSVRRLSGYLALGIGALAVPALMTWSVEWGLLIGGIGAGTLGFALAGDWRRKAGK